MVAMIAETVVPFLAAMPDNVSPATTVYVLYEAVDACGAVGVAFW